MASAHFLQAKMASKIDKVHSKIVRTQPKNTSKIVRTQPKNTSKIPIKYLQNAKKKTQNLIRVLTNLLKDTLFEIFLNVIDRNYTE